MTNKKLKYQEFLALFSDCPPTEYAEIQQLAFRWVHGFKHHNDFVPLHRIQEPPPRMLDDNDKMCAGYGLSMFDSVAHAMVRYKTLYTKLREHLRIVFIEDKGDQVAELQLTVSDGIASLPSPHNYGHFTFHEYETADLRSAVRAIHPIFDAHGKFIL
jgi:hypothetical protein